MLNGFFNDFDPFSKGSLVLYLTGFDFNPGCVFTNRMKESISKTGYASYGQILKNMSISEIIESISFMMGCGIEDRVRICYYCLNGEGFSEVFENTQEIVDYQEFLCSSLILILILRKVGYDLNYEKLSITQPDEKIFRNFTLKSFYGKSFTEIEELVHKEIL